MTKQGKKNYQEKLFTSFKLSDRVIKRQFFRRLKEALKTPITDLNYLINDGLRPFRAILRPLFSEKCMKKKVQLT